jgi:hypothetical protein
LGGLGQIGLQKGQIFGPVKLAILTKHHHRGPLNALEDLAIALTIEQATAEAEGRAGL